MSLVELAPAATLSGIALGARELILKKFCATPSICTSTLGARPILMPITPARVRSPVSPETGYFARWTKSIPASIRKEPGGMISTSSVNSGRCWPKAPTAILNARASAAQPTAIDLNRLITLVGSCSALRIHADCNSPGLATSTAIRSRSPPQQSVTCDRLRITSGRNLWPSGVSRSRISRLSKQGFSAALADLTQPDPTR